MIIVCNVYDCIVKHIKRAKKYGIIKRSNILMMIGIMISFNMNIAFIRVNPRLMTLSNLLRHILSPMTPINTHLVHILNAMNPNAQHCTNGYRGDSFSGVLIGMSITRPNKHPISSGGIVSHIVPSSSSSVVRVTRVEG